MPDAVVAQLADIPDGAGHVVTVGDTEIAVFNLAGTLRAVRNQCPHRGGPLAEGFLEDGRVTCPWHGWEFALDTGVAVHRADIVATCYPVRVHGDDVVVTIPD